MIDIDQDATDALAGWCARTMAEAPSTFAAAQAIALRLGAHPCDGRCEVGFWAPELLERRVGDGDIFLEVLRPEAPLDLTVSRQKVRFSRTLLPVARVDAFCWASVRGMRAGQRIAVGDFYALCWRDAEGAWTRILDPLAASLPFGAFAPAEYYDVAAMQEKRGDRAYYAALGDADSPDAPVKLGPATAILQVHAPTATAGMTLASLTRQIEHLADRVRAGATLEPAERIFLGYDALQLMPVEPTTVYEAGPSFWMDQGAEDGLEVIGLRKPDTTNWGYDVVIAGSAAVNPALLETGRPDELADLAAALHSFPEEPKKLILDVVFGHADNQGLDALNHYYFAGPNMYGQNMNYRNPTVRAILLEMQRRKVNFGADGVRVDGAQDFKWWDGDAQTMRHDDEYLQAMADIEQEVAGRRYRPWMIFEDGRPWPQEDWELASTYRAVIETQRDDDVFQWGPLTFAHNTPFLYTFWLSKFWRIREIVERGENWISGTANHDTLRRGTQISPKLNINTGLGETRMEILDKAYDHAAAQMLTYAAFPGVPMDFLNATARASWGFIRNQDDRYGVKVMAEESISLTWQVDDYTYSRNYDFTRMKDLGFPDRAALERFFDILPALVDVTGYDLDGIARALNQVDPPMPGPLPYDAVTLKQVARAWMDDMHDYCNVFSYMDALGDAQTAYMLDLREFRAARPWLRRNFGPGDHFDYMNPADGATVFRSLRTGPTGEQVFCIAHMEGRALPEMDPLVMPIPGLGGGGWRVAMTAPALGRGYDGGPLSLGDNTGVVFTRMR